MSAAVKAAEPYGITLLGVTVLTSMLEADCTDLLFLNTLTLSERVRALARFGRRYGLKGFVCSPEEVKGLRASFPEAFFLVPGIRPHGAETQDQKRVGTPHQAVQDGASMIVVGRPIRDAADPVKAAQGILGEIQN